MSRREGYLVNFNPGGLILRLTEGYREQMRLALAGRSVSNREYWLLAKSWCSVESRPRTAADAHSSLECFRTAQQAHLSESLRSFET